MVIKAEVVRGDGKDPKDNPRFVITNMKQSPRWIHEHVYCQRGDIENRIKELRALEIDRTSCSAFWANQFRVRLAAAAYALMQELRLRAAGTACARVQAGTLRERLLKPGARVLVSVRRAVAHLPVSFPFLPTFRQVALALGAQSGEPGRAAPKNIFLTLTPPRTRESSVRKPSSQPLRTPASSPASPCKQPHAARSSATPSRRFQTPLSMPS